MLLSFLLLWFDIADFFKPPRFGRCSSPSSFPSGRHQPLQAITRGYHTQQIPYQWDVITIRHTLQRESIATHHWPTFEPRWLSNAGDKRTLSNRQYERITQANLSLFYCLVKKPFDKFSSTNLQSGHLTQQDQSVEHTLRLTIGSFSRPRIWRFLLSCRIVVWSPTIGVDWQNNKGQ